MHEYTPKEAINNLIPGSYTPTLDWKVSKSVSSIADHPELKSAADHPELKSVADHPELKSVGDHPELKSVADHPELKSAGNQFAL